MDDRDDHLRWNEIDSQLVKTCGIFDLYESKRQAQNGKVVALFRYQRMNRKNGETGADRIRTGA